MRVVRIVLYAGVSQLLLLRLNKIEQSSRTPNYLFLCKFYGNNETVGKLPSIKTCVRCAYRFCCKGDRIAHVVVE